MKSFTLHIGKAPQQMRCFSLSIIHTNTLSYDPPSTGRLPVTVIRNLNTITRIAGMNHTAATYVHSHMANSAAAAVENQISRLQVGQAYLSSSASLGRCGMRQAVSKLCIDTHGKSRTVCSTSQAGTAPFIWIAHKLAGIRCNR